MPLKPVRFTSVEDVSELINKLRKKDLLEKHKLKYEFIIGDNNETYLLSDVLELTAEEISFSTLSFQTKDGKRIPLLAREELQNNNSLFLNAPLAQELNKLIPDINLFKVQPTCALSAKPVVFPLITRDEKTIEGMGELESIFGNQNLEPVAAFHPQSFESVNNTNTLTKVTPNYALLDLQMISFKLLRESTSLSADEINEKLDFIQTNLSRVKSLLDEFIKKYPESRAIRLDPGALKADNQQLLDQMLEYKKNIESAKRSVDAKHLEIKNRTKTVKILGGFSITLGTIPYLGYKLYSLHQYKDWLKTDIANLNRLMKLQEEFINMELAKAYALIINPCLNLIMSLQQQLKPVTQAKSHVVDDKELSPVQYSANTLQHTLLPPPPPAPPSNASLERALALRR